MYVNVCAHVCVCVRVCVRARVRMCVCVCVKSCSMQLSDLNSEGVIFHSAIARLTTASPLTDADDGETRMKGNRTV